jgi:hypothetical protein
MCRKFAKGVCAHTEDPYRRKRPQTSLKPRTAPRSLQSPLGEPHPPNPPYGALEGDDEAPLKPQTARVNDSPFDSSSNLLISMVGAHGLEPWTR